MPNEKRVLVGTVAESYLGHSQRMARQLVEAAIPAVRQAGSATGVRTANMGAMSLGIGGIPAGAALPSVLATGSPLSVFQYTLARADRLAMFRYFYRTDPFVGRAVELHSELPLSRLSIGSPKGPSAKQNKEINRIYENMVRRLGLLEFLLELAREYWLVGDVFCHDKLTAVRLADGTQKRIEQVIVGDEVLTAEGTIQKVGQIHKRHFKGKVFRINARGLNRPIVSTGNHPYFTTKGIKSADTIEVGDKLYFPVSREEIPQEDITDEHCELVGWYLAEGLPQKGTSIFSRGRVAFILNDSKAFDVDFQKKLFYLLEKCFPPEPYIGRKGVSHPYLSKSSGEAVTHYYYTNQKAFEFFSREVGNGSHYKKLSRRWLYLPLRQQKLILKAWIKGDGGVDESDAFRGVTTSRNLRDQMQWIAARLGINSRPYASYEGRTVDEQVLRDLDIEGRRIGRFGQKEKFFYGLAVTAGEVRENFWDEEGLPCGNERPNPQKLRELWSQVNERPQRERKFYQHPNSELQRAVEERYEKEGVVAIARDFAVSRGKVSKIAMNLGLSAKRTLRVNWTEEKRVFLRKFYASFKPEHFAELWGCSVDSIFKQTQLMNLHTLYRPTPKVFETFNGWPTLEVNGVEQLDYDDCVYNLGVENQHSYVVEGAAVHNCWHEWDKEIQEWSEVYILPCEYCFHPSSHVMMSDGTIKPICEVKKDDLVLTHTGGTGKVKEVYRNPGRGGKTLRIRANGLPNVLEVTPEHPVFCLKKGKAVADDDFAQGKGGFFIKDDILRLNKVPAASLKVGDFLVYESPLEEKEDPEITDDLAELMGWYLSEGYVDFAGKNSVTDAICFNLANSEEKEVGEIVSLLKKCFPPKVVTTRRRAIPDWRSRLALTPVKRRLDWYDGDCPVCGAPNWFLYNKGPDRRRGLTHRARCKNCGMIDDPRQRTRLEPIISPKREYYHVTIRYSNQEAADFFKREAGVGAANKRLTGRWMILPFRQQKLLLTSYLRGDGRSSYKQLKSLTCNSASYQLISQVRVLLSRLGVRSEWYSTLAGRKCEMRDVRLDPIPSTRERQKCYWLRINTEYAGLLGYANVRWPQSWPRPPVHEPRPARIAYDIVAMEEVDYCGDVYNLTVEPDHSVIVEGVACGQCHSVPHPFLRRKELIIFARPLVDTASVRRMTDRDLYRIAGDPDIQELLNELDEELPEGLKALLDYGEGHPLSTDPKKGSFCVFGGHRIKVDGKYVRLDDVYYNKSVVTEYGKRVTEGVKFNGKRRVMKLKTEMGRTLFATPDHKLRVQAIDGRLYWKELKDLQKGDYILSQRGHQGSLVKDDGSDLDFWYSLGHLYGDGSLVYSGVQKWAVPFGEEETLERLKRWLFSLDYKETERISARTRGMHKVDYLKEKVFTIKVQVSRSGGKVYVLTTDVSSLREILPNYKKEGMWKIDFPEQVYSLGEKQLGALLNGLFTTDGHCRYAKNGKKLLFTSKKRGLVQNVQNLLLLLGIVSKIKPYVRRSKKYGIRRGYVLSVQGRKSHESFLKYVGFSLSRKQKSLEKLAIRKKDHNRDILGFPNAKDLMRLAMPSRHPWGCGGAQGPVQSLIRDVRDGRTSIITDDKIPQVIERLKPIAKQQDVVRALEAYQANDWWFDRVQSVTEWFWEEDTYDMVNVEDTHSFVTDGFVVHNCYHLARNRSPNEAYGMGILERCLETLLRLENLKNAQLQISSRNMQPKHLISAIGIGQKELDDLRAQVDLSLLEQVDYPIVTNYEVHWETVGAQQRLLNVDSEYTILREDLATGLCSTREMLTGAATYGGQRITLELMNTQYLTFRQLIQDYVEACLFRPVAEAKGHYYYEEVSNWVKIRPADIEAGDDIIQEFDGSLRKRLVQVNKVYLHSQLRFNRLSVRDNAEVYEQLFQLHQKGSLALRYLLDIHNIDPEENAAALLEDIMTVRDPVFNRVLEGIYQVVAEPLVQNTDIIDRVIKGMNLDVVSQVQGEPSPGAPIGGPSGGPLLGGTDVMTGPAGLEPIGPGPEGGPEGVTPAPMEEGPAPTTPGSVATTPTSARRRANRNGTPLYPGKVLNIPQKESLVSKSLEAISVGRRLSKRQVISITSSVEEPSRQKSQNSRVKHRR